MASLQPCLNLNFLAARQNRTGIQDKIILRAFLGEAAVDAMLNYHYLPNATKRTKLHIYFVASVSEGMLSKLYIMAANFSQFQSQDVFCCFLHVPTAGNSSDLYSFPSFLHLVLIMNSPPSHLQLLQYFHLVQITWLKFSFYRKREEERARNSCLTT